MKITENTLEIGFPDRFTLERMQKDENKKILSTAVSEVLNEKFRVLMKEYPDKNEKKESKNKENRTEQEESNESDREIVQEALNIFEGEVIREE